MNNQQQRDKYEQTQIDTNKHRHMDMNKQYQIDR